MRPIIQSKKHYVQTSLATVTAGTPTNIVLVKTVADTPDTVEEVHEGAIVKAIYIELWLRSGSATNSSGQTIFYKKSSDTTNPSATDMAALGDWDNKKNIFYTTMGLINDVDSLALPIFKGWIKIPKGKQRFGLADKFQITIFSPTVDQHVCGFATYKEYT